jgi:S1-C subfamily serine protease
MTTLALLLCLAAGDADQALLDATVRLRTEGSTATAFLVKRGEDLVLVTAAHCLEEIQEAEATLVIRAAGPDGTLVRKKVQVLLRENGKPRWRRHPDRDVAAMKLTLPGDARVKPLKPEQLAEAVPKAGDAIRVAGYPAGVEGGPQGWAILRAGIVSAPPNGPTFLVDAPIYGGESGGPVAVCTGAEPLVVGVQSGMHRRTDKTSIPFEERTVHHPLGIGIVVPAAAAREAIRLLE